MAKVYVAGPMRGYPDLNYPAFDGARDRARNAGWDVVSPADIDREMGTVGLGQDGPKQARVFAELDLAALLSFRGEDGDAIALLPGWEKSTGARAEFFVARWLQLRVLDATTLDDLGPVGITIEPAA